MTKILNRLTHLKLMLQVWGRMQQKKKEIIQKHKCNKHKFVSIN
jgi:hypothetical protein